MNHPQEREALRELEPFLERTYLPTSSGVYRRAIPADEFCLMAASSYAFEFAHRGTRGCRVYLARRAWVAAGSSSTYPVEPGELVVPIGSTFDEVRP